VKAALEAGHSIGLQVRRPKLGWMTISIVVTILAVVVGCRFSDLDLHLKEGALTYGQSVNPIPVVSQPPLP